MTTDLPTPQKTQRVTILIMAGVGAAIFLFISGIASYEYWRKSKLAETHTPVTATVEAVGTLCALEKKVGKRWDTEQIIACDEARNLAATRNSFITPWRATEGQYVQFIYDVNGSAQRNLKHVAVFGDTVAAGQTFAMYADPADPQSVEMPMDAEDTNLFWTMLGFGAVIGAATAAVGWVVAYFNRRRQDKVLAAGGSVTPSGEVLYPTTTQDGQAIVYSQPTWARVVKYAGITILVLGLVIGALAAIGSDGNPAALRGGFVIALISAAIWRLCAYIAGRARVAA